MSGFFAIVINGYLAAKLDDNPMQVIKGLSPFRGNKPSFAIESTCNLYWLSAVIIIERLSVTLIHTVAVNKFSYEKITHGKLRKYLFAPLTSAC